MEYGEMVEEYERDKKQKEQGTLAATACYAALAKKVEDYAALRAYNAGMGAGEWEAFLTPSEIELLTKLAAIGYGTWAKEKQANEKAEPSARSNNK